MVDILRAVSPLHQPHRIAGEAVVIEEVCGLQIASLAAGGAALPALRQYWGVDLPLTPRRVVCGTEAFIWAGPERWLVTSTAVPDLERVLRDRLGSAPAITDQSDGRCVLRISGPKARATLAKLLPIDLHPRVFTPADTAMTMAAHINLQIWQTAADAYELCLFRGYADHFHHALSEAAAAFAP